MGGILTLVCGILVLVGVFTPWLSITDVGVLSGWDVANYEVGAASLIEPYLVLGGGSVMIVCVLLALLLSLGGDISGAISTLLNVLAKIAAALVLIGAVWFIVISLTGKIGEYIGQDYYSLGYGSYISIFAGVLAVIFGRMPSFSLRGAIVHDSAAAPAAPVKPQSYSQRERLERQADGLAGDVPVSPARSSEPKVTGAASFAGVIKDHMSRASDFESRGEYLKAIGEYGKAIALDKHYAMAYFNRGVVFMQQGKTADATTDFEKVIEIGDNPDLTRMAQARLNALQQ